VPSLKDLKVRIESVKSTRKITSAMKMVAASKLRRAQEQAEAGRPYAEAMARITASLASNLPAGGALPKLLAGTQIGGGSAIEGGKDSAFATAPIVVLIVVTSDRGLCGPFNGSVVREARRQIRKLVEAGKDVKIVCVGRKGLALLKREFAFRIVASYEDVGKRRLSFGDAQKIAAKVLEMSEDQVFEGAYLI
jgi:F-type H+-transporting ATPase subunit gamma